MEKVKKSVTSQRPKRQTNPNSLANLKPFPKGVSGCPGGPGPGYKHRGAIYRRILELPTPIERPDGTKEKISMYEAIALGQAKSAMQGNTRAWAEIQDSLHGKLTDNVKVISDSDAIVDAVIAKLKSSGYDDEKIAAFTKANFPELATEVVS